MKIEQVFNVCSVYSQRNYLTSADYSNAYQSRSYPLNSATKQHLFLGGVYMDTVQMNKKIKEIMDSSDFYLLSEDAAKAIGVAPQKLREQAKDEPEKLGFNVIVVGTSIRIPRIPFLNYILGSNPMKGV